MEPTAKEIEAIITLAKMRIAWLKSNIRVYRHAITMQAKRKRDFEAICKLAPHASQLDDISKGLFEFTVDRVCRDLVLAKNARKHIRAAIAQIREHQATIKKWS